MELQPPSPGRVTPAAPTALPAPGIATAATVTVWVAESTPAAAGETVLTLVANARLAPPGTPLESVLDPAVLARMTQGQVVRFLATLPQTLPVGTQMQLAVGPGQPPKILSLDSPADLPPALRIALTQALTGQGNPQALLQALVQLVDASGPRDLPEALGRLAARIRTLLLSPETVQTPGALKDWVERSGVFFESRLARQATSAAPPDSAPPQDSPESSPKAGRTDARPPKTLPEASMPLRQAQPSSHEALPERPATKSTPTASAGTGMGATGSSAAGPQVSRTDTAGLSVRAGMANAMTGDRPTVPAPQTSATPGPDAIEAPPDDFKALLLALKDALSGDAGKRDVPISRGQHAPTLPEAASERHRLPAPAPRQDPVPTATPARHAPASLKHYQAIDRLAPRVSAPELTASMPLPIPGELPIPLKPTVQRLRRDDPVEQWVQALVRHTQEALSRTTLHQLAMSGTLQPDTPNPPPVVSVDIPLVLAGQVHLFNTQINVSEREASGADRTGPKREKQWTVSLGFDLEELGPMFCQFMLTGQQGALHIWADRASTRARIESESGTLSEAMTRIGVQLAPVHCHDGLPQNAATRLTQQLVDINT